MLELTNKQDLSEKEEIVFNFMQHIVSEAVALYRCKADGPL